MRRFAPVVLLLLVAAAPEAPLSPLASPALPAPQPPTAPSTAGPHMPPTVALQHVPPAEAMPVLGHTVAGPEGKVIARLINVLVDAEGEPVAAVLDFGGFMGVGERTIAVHWNALHFVPADPERPIILAMTPDEIKAAPEYKDPNKPAQVVVPTGATAKPVTQ